MREGAGPLRQGGSSVPASSPVLVDAHVHFYSVFEEARFFEGAWSNVRRCAVDNGLPEDTFGWLCLTETGRDHAFAAFAGRAGDASREGWSFRATAEDCSLVVCRDGREVLGLVAGRQIVTAEGLEVLALGTTARFPDGAGLDATLERVRRTDALAVLPWGFGKWTARRGALVEERIRTAGESGTGRGLFLGDNGGRPALGPRPPLLGLAEARGLVVLPGSDPLPLPGREDRVAGYGFVLDGGVAGDRPAEALKRRLRALPTSPPSYGRATRLLPFVRNQIFMQLRKHGFS